MTGNEYKFKEYEDTMKKIEDVMKPVLKLRKVKNNVGPQDLKDKLGDKLTMATMIINFTNTCLEAKKLLGKMHGLNFELRGKIVELSSTATNTKSMMEEICQNQGEIIGQMEEIRKKTSTADTGEMTLAEIVGRNSGTDFVEPMKQAIKEVEKEDERAKNVILHGLDIVPDVNVESQKKQLKANARDCLTEAARIEDKDIVDFKILGRIVKSDRAPPVLVTLKSSQKAGLVIKNASELSKVHHLRRVYISPDLSQEDRQKRKKLIGDLKEKINQFPEEHWVIRGDTITSKGKFTPRGKLDSTDQGKDLDRSYNY